MALLSQEISAYEDMQSELEVDFPGKWALVHNESLIGKFDTFEDAAEHAVTKFGRGPYLIRQIGAPPISLRMSVIGEPVRPHASDS